MLANLFLCHVSKLVAGSPGFLIIFRLLFGLRSSSVMSWLLLTYFRRRPGVEEAWGKKKIAIGFRVPPSACRPDTVTRLE